MNYRNAKRFCLANLCVLILGGGFLLVFEDLRNPLNQGLLLLLALMVLTYALLLGSVLRTVRAERHRSRARLYEHTPIGQEQHEAHSMDEIRNKKLSSFLLILGIVTFAVVLLLVSYFLR